jgi:hypothetical protein
MEKLLLLWFSALLYDIEVPIYGGLGGSGPLGEAPFLVLFSVCRQAKSTREDFPFYCMLIPSH